MKKSFLAFSLATSALLVSCSQDIIEPASELPPRRSILTASLVYENMADTLKSFTLGNVGGGQLGWRMMLPPSTGFTAYDSKNEVKGSIAAGQQEEIRLVIDPTIIIDSVRPLQRVVIFGTTDGEVRVNVQINK